MTLRLPRDILYEIFSQLSVDDLLNVSLSCRRFDEMCAPLLYRTVHLTWQDIEDINQALEAGQNEDNRLTYLRKAVISANGRGEWKSSPKLRSLAVASEGYFSELRVTCELRSSGWFKYVDPLDSILYLELVPSGTCQNHTFDFGHIARCLPNLESISLGDSSGGFIIDPYPNNGLCHLQRIRAENCQWGYPTKLMDACENSRLEELELVYTIHMHAFAFSERFQSEFRHLPRSLKVLKVDVQIGMELKWNPLTRSRSLPELEEVILRGFEFHYDYSREKAGKFPKLRYLSETSNPS